MIKTIAIRFCASALIVSLGLMACTRAKPESATPTVVIGALTETPGTSVPTTPTPAGTQVITPEPPPTSIPLTPGQTRISVTDTTPTLVPAVTPGLTMPTLTPLPGEFEYTVQWGDTVFSLARRFNTTVESIVSLNGLADASYIRVGQVLKIRGTPGPAPGAGVEYIVQAGDTLFSIARRYGTTVEAIQRANGIVNPWYIRVGQRLVISQGSASPSSPTADNTYVVQAGDTLYGIAALLGINAWDLIVANNLSDPYWIYVDQVLVVP
jgi:LysM repeat protein